MNRPPLLESARRLGVRLTRARRVILAVLDSASEHLKVAELHRRVCEIDPRVGLASVYRTLDLLAHLRLVQHVRTDHRHRHYARLSGDHAHHLVCSGCGRVVEFSECHLDQLCRLLARRTRFQIDGHHIELFGRCPDCRQTHPRRRLARPRNLSQPVPSRPQRGVAHV